MDGQPQCHRCQRDPPPARNTPTIFNVGLNAAFNWDGIANTLEAHAEIVLLHPSLMNTTWPELLAKLRADADYVDRLQHRLRGRPDASQCVGCPGQLRALLAHAQRPFRPLSAG